MRDREIGGEIEEAEAWRSFVVEGKGGEGGGVEEVGD